MNKPYGYLIGEGFGQKFIPANGFFAKREDLSNAIPLYTHPVKQLSDEEIAIIWAKYGVPMTGMEFKEVVQAIIKASHGEI